MKRITLKLKFLGGCNEIGRIAIAVKKDDTQILLDYGVLFNDQPGFPMHIPPREVDAIFLTHAHLDHSGGIPLFHITSSVPVYGTKLTFELSELLIADFIKLSGYYLPFEYLDLRSMMRNCVFMEFGKPVTVKDMKVTLLDSGHIPGGGQILIETEKKRILYTGDFNTIDTELLKGADTEYGKLDCLIIESTYANEDHPERRSLEKSFVESVEEVVEEGGTVLIPAFSVGRAQEIACVLRTHNFNHPVYMDGMARKVNLILLNNLTGLRDPMLFKDTMHMVREVGGWKERREAMRKPGVIIAPAGMLKGGPAAYYIQHIGKKKNNAVFLVGFQVPGTPGSELIEKGRCVIDGKVRKVKARVEKFDFSSHCGARELKETVKSLEGNPKVFVIHGANTNCLDFAEWIKSEVGLDAEAPETGDVASI